MSAQRLVGLSFLLCAGVACAPRSGTQAPKPVRGENGPKASLQVRYSGGLFYRSVNASFRVDEPAHVIVGHLGGDGVIRVLYPSNPMHVTRFAKQHESVPVKTFTAASDGAPMLFSYAQAPFRSLGAMMDSYDGRGHGFVFMIASRSELNVDAITDGFEWDEIEVTDYELISDPRRAIREFAESVTWGDKYTLKFATSFTSQGYTSYASNAWDCSLLSSLGYGYLGNFWGSWGLGGLSFLGWGGSPYSSRPVCGGSRYASYDYYPARQRYVHVYVPQTSGPTQPPPPTGPITPILTRPTKRTLENPSRGVLVGRSPLDRPTTTANRSSGLERSPASRSRDNDVYRPSSRAGLGDGPRAASPRGDSPRADSPRSSPPPRTEAPRASAPPRNPPATTTTPAKATTTTKQ